MELLNNIWSALTTPNETLINIILIPTRYYGSNSNISIIDNYF